MMLQRRGTIYVIVLATAMLVTLLGLGSLLSVRVERAAVQLTTDATDARLGAQSALSLGLLLVVQDPNWRTTQSNGDWLTEQPLGTTTISLTGVDPDDADLANADTDTLVLTGIGSKGRARHQTEVTLLPVIESLSVLNTCLHATGLITVQSGKRITTINAPLSTNGTLDNGGTIDGHVEVNKVTSSGTVTGTLTTGVSTKQMPNPNLFDIYKAKATLISMPGDIDKEVLTATHNPWGAANAEGVYYIDTGGKDIYINNTRIEGTLLIDAGSKALIFNQTIFMHRVRSDYPTLMVRGNVELRHHSATVSLSEADVSTNFNPVGAPYEGQTDSDMIDIYPNEVQGLIYVIGNMKWDDTALVRGVVICSGDVEFNGDNRIIHDPSFYATAPEGFTFVRGMEIAPNSYRRVVD